MSILSKFKKIEAQINPFDGGATYNHPQQAQAPPQGAGHPQLRVGESYMNTNPVMAPQAMSSGVRASYMNVQPGVAQLGTIQPIHSQLQANWAQPQQPQLGAYRTGQLQVQPSYLNLQ